MTDGLIDIDHVMLSVADLDRAAATFERLGFTLTPNSKLPGMSNRLVCFAPRAGDRCNFVELLTLENTDAAPPLMQQLLIPANRPVATAVAARDMDAAQTYFEKQGFSEFQSLHIKRDWLLPSGEVISPEFTVAIPPYGQSPLYWFPIRYADPALYRRAEFINHPNSANGLAGVIATAAEPRSVGDHYLRIWNARVTEETAGIVKIALGHVALWVLSQNAAMDLYSSFHDAPPAQRSRYLGFVVAVRDFTVLQQRLEAYDVPHRRGGLNGGLWVGPHVTHGSLLQFQAQTTD